MESLYQEIKMDIKKELLKALLRSYIKDLMQQDCMVGQNARPGILRIRRIMSIKNIGE